jgi:hypothetical protein
MKKPVKKSTRSEHDGRLGAFSFGLLTMIVLSVFCVRGVAAGNNPADDSETSKVRIEVRAGEQNKPVANASVYIRFEQGRRHKLAEMNLKTNEDGTTKVPGVPRGKVLVQVIADGWKTFGQWYKLEKEEELIQIKLERPPKWY